MKYLFLILLPFNSFAGGFFALDKYGALPESFKLYEFKDQCELIEYSSCYDIEICPIEECDLVSEVEFGYPNGKKRLKFNSKKKADYEAAKNNKELADKALNDSKVSRKSELKVIDWTNITTITQLKEILQKLIEIQH